jgi:hypothetical protein
MPIEGLRLSDIVATGAGGLRASDTKGLELTDIRMDASQGPAFLVRDSSGLRLDQLSTGTAAPGLPALRLDRCPGARIDGWQAAGDGAGSISVGPGERAALAPASAQLPIEEKTGDFWSESGNRAP